MNKKLYRSTVDRKLLGVCGGLGEYFNIDSTLFRIAFILFSFGGGSGILLYFITALLMPERPE